MLQGGLRRIPSIKSQIKSSPSFNLENRGRSYEELQYARKSLLEAKLRRKQT